LPILQFNSCALSAHVHDIDHQGTSTMQLVKEGTVIATRYNNKSLAEQNAIDIRGQNLWLTSIQSFARQFALPATICRG
jgi:3'5'-cyclic nucleotide phosphodiesterase